MERKKGSALLSFLKGFVITLVVLIPAYIGVYRFSVASAEEKLNPVPVAAEETAVPLAPKNYNLLYLTAKDGTRELIGASLIRFDTNNSRIVACALPLDTVLLFDKQPRTLFQIYEKNGGAATSECVSGTLGITLSGYVAADEKVLSSLIDTLGGFPFLLERDFQVTNDEDIIIYTKYAGSSDFSGNDTVMLLLHPEGLDGDFVSLRGRLLEAALREFGRRDFSKKLSEAYSDEINKTDTDISLSGMYALTKAAAYVCVDGKADVALARLEGEDKDGRYELTDAACKRINELFGASAERD